MKENETSLSLKRKRGGVEICLLGSIMYNNSINILKKIEQYGFEAYIVGGFVRDYYMKKDLIDVDICTNARPQNLKDIFNNIVYINEDLGVTKAIEYGIIYEITTYRKELEYTDRRNIKIEYVSTLKEDIIRRDFTINSLCMDSNGNIIDLLGGIEDINNKIIKTIGDTFEKLKQDPLRIMRAIRFATTLNFKLDSSIKKVIISNGNLINNISYYRKKEELDKIFKSDNVSYGLSLIKELCLDKLLGINEIVVTSSLIGIWAQVEGKYPFDKQEITDINNIKEILLERKIGEYSLYKYGIDICYIAGEILHINKDVIDSIYNSMQIHFKSDISIKYNEIKDILNSVDDHYVKSVYNDIEYKLIYSILENNKSSIEKYIIDTYLI